MSVDNTEEFRCISLCTGYAGIELGLQRVIPNLRTVAYVEIEAFAAANLVAKMEAGKLDAAPIWTDIKTFPAQGFRNRVHIVTAGYPCQPFSIAGKRKGTDDPRHLWPHIERIIEAVRPVWCFFENVPGHLSLGFPEVYRSLRNMGYAVEAGLFTAAEVGAPHRRQRLFVLAYNTICRFKDVQIQQKGKSSSCDGGRCLADAERAGERQGAVEKAQAGIGRIRFAEQRSVVADTGKAELSGRQSKPGNNGEKFTAFTGSCHKWPARPGQPQNEWEEPRVVEYAGSGTSKGLSQSEGRNLDREVGNPGGQGQAQSGVGRAASRCTCGMDRLRLLGNGVVPQQAELAFRYLIGLFNSQG